MSDLAAAFEAVLPRQSGYGHVTAAALRGWWLPWLPVDLPLLATTTSGVHVQRSGLYVRRSLHTSMVQTQPMSLVDPASCLLEMAVDLALVDMVPLVDIALRTGCTVDEIRAAAWPGRRGARTLRRALALSDPRSESAWESILRLLHVLTGFTEVEPQAPICDATGAVVARADLLLCGTRRIHEYDGAVHRDPDQHAADLAREKTLARSGFERYGYTAAEIVSRPGRIVTDAEEALGLPRNSQRLQRWLYEVKQSTLSPSGRMRLRQRLERYARAGRRGRPRQD
jgi:very-short-patch-repair endonuclease